MALSTMGLLFIGLRKRRSVSHSVLFPWVVLFETRELLQEDLGGLSIENGDNVHSYG